MIVARHEVPGIRKKRSPSRRDGVIRFSRLSLQRSCWHVLVHRLAYNGDVVAFKMGRRQGVRRAHI